MLSSLGMTRSTKGFSLIEVTLAVALIGLIIVATGVMLERIPVGGREARDTDIALRIARSEIELLRSAGYAALPAGGEWSDPLLSSLASSTAALLVTDANAQTKQVEATVSWRGADLAPRSVSLTTLLTKDSGLK